MRRSIDTSLWSDARVEKLTPNAKLLWLYLLTSPQGNLAGCFELTMRRVEVDTGLKAAQARKALDELCATCLIAYSADTYEVLIIRWSKQNWSSSPKLVKPLSASIASIKDEGFRAFIAERYEEVFGEPPSGFTKPQENMVSIPYRYPSISISNTISTTNLEESTSNLSQVRMYGAARNVILTEDELSKLQAKFPNDWEARIDDLSLYIGSKGDHYKSHYLTILNWARKEESPDDYSQYNVNR